jgi:hypothetical protein
MTRTPHDQFAKQCMLGFLEPFGKPLVSREVSSEVRQVDVWFEPNPSSAAEARQILGLLGRMVEGSCLIEPFRNPVQAVDVRGCLGKLFDVEIELLRQAKRQKTLLPEADLPRLWILAPTVSKSVWQGFGAAEKEDWSEGLYFLPAHNRCVLVCIHQLPVSADTLWLRLLGRGTVQSQAVTELLALPATHPFRRHTLEQLANLRVSLQARQNLNKDERGLIMSLSPVYERWKEETLQKGIQEGIQQGKQEQRRELLEVFLVNRFGAVDAEMASLIPTMARLSDAEFARLMLQMANLSREELLERFGR